MLLVVTILSIVAVVAVLIWLTIVLVEDFKSTKELNDARNIYMRKLLKQVECFVNKKL